MPNKTDKDKNHPIVKRLLAMGYKNIVLIYEPYYSPDWGWTLVGCDIHLTREPFFGFLGYSIADVIKNMDDRLPPEIDPTCTDCGRRELSNYQKSAGYDICEECQALRDAEE